VRRRLLALAAEGTRPPEAHASLRRRLGRVDRADRDAAWLEARLLVDGWFHRDHRGAMRRLRRLREVRAEAGQTALFEEFWAELCRITAPRVLARHGYQIPLEHRDARAVWAEVARLGDRVTELGYECWLTSGALLGLQRDGRLIAHDDDVDLAVLLPGPGTRGVVDAWLDLKAQLRAAGLLRLDFEDRPRAHAKLVSGHGVTVDLFPAWLEGDRLHAWPLGELPASDVLPLRPIEVEGATVRLPRDPEAVLVLNYGPDWRTPDPSFAFDWVDARRRFASFVAEISR
jgi:hypothetical protein